MKRGGDLTVDADRAEAATLDTLEKTPEAAGGIENEG
jgi:hypothetical protein